MREKGRFIMFTYKDVLKNAVRDLWQDGSYRVDGHFFEDHDIAEAIRKHDDDAIVDMLTDYLDNCVKHDVVDGDIIVDENDPLYDDVTVDGKVTRDGLLFILEN
jgi:hypothetical protein